MGIHPDTNREMESITLSKKEVKSKKPVFSGTRGYFELDSEQ